MQRVAPVQLETDSSTFNSATEDELENLLLDNKNVPQ